MLETEGDFEFPRESAFESQHSGLLAAYLRTKSQIDALLVHFAQTLEWPELVPLERFFIAARLEFAWEVASMLGTAHQDSELISVPKTEKGRTPEVLEWLLIDVWPHGCARFLQKQKAAMQQGSALQTAETPIHFEPAHAECVA